MSANTPQPLPLRAVVLTSSDRCARGETTDLSGPAVSAWLRDALGAEVIAREVVPDEADRIEAFLRCFSAPAAKVDLAVVTGGTGLAPRDVTPEAAMRVIERPHTGLMELARSRCGMKHARAFLSRGVAGATGATLILTLPGSPTGAVEMLDALRDVLPHALRMLRGVTASDAHSDLTA